MSGDPSRGTISLDSDAAPAEGSTVQVTSVLLPVPAPSDDLYSPLPTMIQIFHRSKDTPIIVPSSFLQPHSMSNTLAFLTCSHDIDLESGADTSLDATEDVQVYPNTFLAGSENGFVLRRAGTGEKDKSGRWSCTVPNGLVSLTWSQLVAGR